MEIDPFSMLEVSLQEGPDDSGGMRSQPSAGVMHAVENDAPMVQMPLPPLLNCFGVDAMGPQRAVLSNIQKLSSTTKDEERFRKKAYSSITLVLRKRLHCTICDAHIGAYIGLKEKDIEHPLLKVLACTKCTLMYHYIDFPLNPDGRDVRCRWCTQSGKGESPLRYCTYCPFAFCEMCIYRNLPLDELASKSNWMCFVCNGKDLWPSRAILWALRVLIDTNLYLKEEKKWSTDQSTCCKNRETKKRQIARPLVPPALTSAPITNGNKPLMKLAPKPSIIPTRPIVPRPGNYQQVPRSPMAGTRPPTPGQMIQPRMVKPPVRPNQPPSGAPQGGTLYDTTWLTNKVAEVKNTLNNLDNNLRRLTQGVAQKENRYSIKSKMITLVSLLNISASHLQKVSKEMEDESRWILDSKRPKQIADIATTNSQPSTSNRILPVNRPVVPHATPSTSGVKRPAPKSRMGRNNRYRNKRRRTDSDSDPDDPDFKSKAQVERIDNDDAMEGSDSETEQPTEEIVKKECFVKLERLDDKIVECLEEDPQPPVSEGTDVKTLENGDVSSSEAPDAPAEGDAPDSSGDSARADAGIEETSENNAVPVVDTSKSDIEEQTRSADRPSEEADSSSAVNGETDDLPADVSGSPAASNDSPAENSDSPANSVLADSSALKDDESVGNSESAGINDRSAADSGGNSKDAVNESAVCSSETADNCKEDDESEEADESEEVDKAEDGDNVSGGDEVDESGEAEEADTAAEGHEVGEADNGVADGKEADNGEGADSSSSSSDSSSSSSSENSDSSSE